MAQFPYTLVTGRLKELLSKIQGVGVPPKADAKWLTTLGYSSTNDRASLSVLKFIGFIDRADVPTQLWKDFRGANSKAAMANALMSGYKELYETYPDAHQRRNDELESFFKSHSKAGAQAIGKTVTTFKALCELADFSSVPSPTPVSGEIKEVLSPSPGVLTPSQPKVAVPGHGLTININIQLTLPEGADEAVYEKFFAAMKKHLLPGDGHNA